MRLIDADRLANVWTALGVQDGCILGKRAKVVNDKACVRIGPHKGARSSAIRRSDSIRVVGGINGRGGVVPIGIGSSVAGAGAGAV